MAAYTRDASGKHSAASASSLPPSGFGDPGSVLDTAFAAYARRFERQTRCLVDALTDVGAAARAEATANRSADALETNAAFVAALKARLPADCVSAAEAEAGWGAEASPPSGFRSATVATRVARCAAATDCAPPSATTYADFGVVLESAARDWGVAAAAVSSAPSPTATSWTTTVYSRLSRDVVVALAEAGESADASQRTIRVLIPGAGAGGLIKAVVAEAGAATTTPPAGFGKSVKGRPDVDAATLAPRQLLCSALNIEATETSRALLSFLWAVLTPPQPTTKPSPQRSLSIFPFAHTFSDCFWGDHRDRFHSVPLVSELAFWLPTGATGATGGSNNKSAPTLHLMLSDDNAFSDEACQRNRRRYDAIITSFVIDAVDSPADVARVLSAIDAQLAPGGVWANVGALHYHSSGKAALAAPQLAYADIVAVFRDAWGYSEAVPTVLLPARPYAQSMPLTASSGSGEHLLGEDGGSGPMFTAVYRSGYSVLRKGRPSPPSPPSAEK